MPTSDSSKITAWSEEDVQQIFQNEQYQHHFAELITRRLRRQLQPERQQEPKYRHSLNRMEAAALYFLECALDSKKEDERRALFHESAILFEQLSYLFLEPDLIQENAPELAGHRFIIASLCYYLAGYEANAIVLAREYLRRDFHKDFIAIACAQLIAKRLMDLKKTLATLLSEESKPASIIQELDQQALTVGDTVYLAAKRSFSLGLAAFQHWIRTGESSLNEEAVGRLRLSIKGFDACGRILDAMIGRLLIHIFISWSERSIWKGLSSTLEGGSNDIWNRYIRLLSTGEQPITEFWRSQINLIEPLLNLKEGLVVSMPTSAGKTRVAEIAILNELTRSSKKIIYVVPTRSLASEVEKALSKRLPLLGFSVSSLFGGYELSEFEQELIEKKRVLVVTPEKLDLLMRQNRDFISQVALVVIDEGHQVAQGTRGLRLEFIMSRIRWHAAKTGLTKLLFLSAVLPNGDEIAKWIAGDEAYAMQVDWKPTRLRPLAFKWGSVNPNDGQLLYLESIGKEIEQFVPGILDRKKVADRDKVLAELAIHFVGIGSVLVFTIKPATVEKIAGSIVESLIKQGRQTLSRSQGWIDQEIIPRIAKTVGAEHGLVKCLKHGFAFHYGPLPNDVRLLIENAVRREIIPLVVANETLAQGVNLPIKTLIIDTVHRGDAPMSVRDFWNVAGRTGRAAQEIEGTLIFLPDKDWNYPPYLGPFLDKNIESCESVILKEGLQRIAPNYWEWTAEWKKKWGGKFVNPWPIILENSVSKVRHIFSEDLSIRFKEFMASALADRLRPGYKNWTAEDKWNWQNIFLDALKKVFVEEKALSELVNIDTRLEERLQEIVDSQILAMAAEEILDPIDPESLLAWIPYTMFGANRLTTEEMRLEYGKGLRQRLLKVVETVPDEKQRAKFNRTGLSLAGNAYLSKNIDIVKDVLQEWIDAKVPWTDVLRTILEVVNEIPDLKPKRGRKRTVECMLDWVSGLSISKIAEKHFKGDLIKAVEVVEGSISSLIPWGVQSLFTLMADEELNYDARHLSLELKNLPALVSFGLPTSTAAFAYSAGIRDREIAIIVGKLFDEEHEGQEISYALFVQWFYDLVSREKELRARIDDAEIVKFILSLSVEMDLLEYLKRRSIIFKIDNAYRNLFMPGEEVLLHVSEHKGGKCILSIYNYLYKSVLKWRIAEELGNQIEQNEHIAHCTVTEDGMRLVVDFVASRN